MSDLPDHGIQEPPPETGAPPAPPPPSAARRRSNGSNFLGTLGAGLRLALLRRPALDSLRLEPGLFWMLMLCALLLTALLGWFDVEAPRRFSRWALESQGAYFLLTLLIAFVLARAAKKMDLLWPIAVLLSAASLYSDSLTSLAEHHLLPRLAPQYPAAHWVLYGAAVAWLAAVIFRILGALRAMRGGRALLAAALVTGGTAGISMLMPQIPFWRHDYAAERAQGPAQPAPLVAEEVFSRQDELLGRALAGVAPGVPGRPSLYFVAFAPDGEQDVFMKEARYGTRLFQSRFGAAQRSLTLVNNRRTVDELPLATAANLERGLHAIAHKMNPEQDILFLYLTSHGSRDAELAVQLDDFSFSPFTAPRLAQILKDSGIRWKVILVSACYSGSFLDSLKDDHSLVMTAARADRTSFGCSDDAEFTWFGRAYLQQALNQTSSFTEAFARARALVDQWETRDREQHSEPQMAKGALIGAKLEQWQATLPDSRSSGGTSRTARAVH